jgi:hypothetical protein
MFSPQLWPHLKPENHDINKFQFAVYQEAFLLK